MISFQIPSLTKTVFYPQYVVQLSLIGTLSHLFLYHSILSIQLSQYLQLISFRHEHIPYINTKPNEQKTKQQNKAKNNNK